MKTGDHNQALSNSSPGTFLATHRWVEMDTPGNLLTFSRTASGIQTQLSPESGSTLMELLVNLGLVWF